LVREVNPSSKYKIIELNSDLYLQRLLQDINGYLRNGHEVLLDPSCARNTVPLIFRLVVANVSTDEL
jgi:hypothetical protein